ncbi:MAG: glycosyltransferase family 9 protein [Cytophagales bacterium]
MPNPKKLLVIQTAFIGDAILVSSLIESLKSSYPSIELSLMLRKGNEGLFHHNPQIQHLYVWEKSQKWKSFIKLLKIVRQEKFDAVFCIQRHFTMGLFAILSGAKSKIGFNENPLSFLFNKKTPHAMGNGKHEVERNLDLASLLFSEIKLKEPKLYVNDQDLLAITHFQNEPYVCMAPSSVWQTKQLPVQKWVEMIDKIQYKVFLLGAPSDKMFIDKLINSCSNKEHVFNLSGKLSLMQSAALMKNAKMNFVNDSGPLHLCSAVDAPVVAFFCSTVPRFGFGPRSKVSFIIESDQNLSCRPCGMHGKKQCPLKHFACGNSINVDEALKSINSL